MAEPAPHVSGADMQSHVVKLFESARTAADELLGGVDVQARDPLAAALLSGALAEALLVGCAEGEPVTSLGKANVDRLIVGGASQLVQLMQSRARLP